MDSLSQDLRFAVRTLRRYPTVTAGVLLILTLGIGATTAIFSVVDAALVRPLPYADESRIVHIRHLDRAHGPMDGRFSPPDFEDLVRTIGSFEPLAAYRWEPGQSLATLTGRGDPEMVAAASVSAAFFDALGVEALLGRTFAPEELGPGKDGVVVLGYRYWQSRFDGDPEILGQGLVLDGSPLTVIGVLPPRVTFPSEDVQVWVPLSLITEAMIPRARQLRWLQVIGRLAPGISAATAHIELDSALRELAAAFPDSNEGWTSARLQPLREFLVGEVQPALLLLFASTGLILLIVCTNVGSLLLTQATARSREVAIRCSVGATPLRIVRQMLSESLVLALLGGTFGLAFAALSLRVLMTTSAGSALPATSLSTNWRLAAFAFVASLATGVLFGLIPALRAWKLRAAQELTTRSTGTSKATARVRGALVVAELAIALTLVVGSILTISSFSRLVSVDPGFTADNVWLVRLRIPSGVEDIVRYRKELVEAVRTVPGIVSASGSKNSPLAGGGEPYTFTFENADGSRTSVHPESGTYIVMRGFFDTLGVSFSAGRGFEAGDSVLNVVVNRSLAEQFWPGRSAIGEPVWIGDNRLEVIGVVEDLHHDGLAQDTRSAVYVLADAFPRSSLYVYVKLAPGATGAIEGVRNAIRDVNPDQAITSVTSLKEMLSEHVGRPRFLSRLVTLFATLALVLATVGIYGVMSYSVQARQSEFGVRLALGAPRANLLRGVLRHSFVLSLIGVGLGSIASWWAAKLLAGVLYGVGDGEPATLVIAVGVVVTASMVASVVPAIRATRVDPALALRAD